MNFRTPIAVQMGAPCGNRPCLRITLRGCTNQKRTDMSRLTSILDKAVDGERLDARRGRGPVRCRDLQRLGRAADAVTRRLHPSRTAPTTSTATSTTPTSAPRSATSAPSTARAATPTPTSCRARSCTRRSRRPIALGGDQILMQGGMHPVAASWSGTKSCSATSRPASRRSTCTPSARRRSGTSTSSTSCRCARCCSG